MARKKTSERSSWKTWRPKYEVPGECYKIHLERGRSPNWEGVTITVGLRGQVFSYEYYSRGESTFFRRFDGMDAVEFARSHMDPEGEYDPVWKESG